MPIDSPTVAALQSGQLIIADFLTVHGWDSDGDPVDFCFWTGAANVIVNVIDARDGSTVSRNFIGGGAIPEDGIPSIVEAIGLEARSHSIALNPLHPSIRDMANGANIRVATVELHRGYRDPETWAFVSTPFSTFPGRVDGAPQDTEAVNDDGSPAETSLTLEVIGDAIDLTRTNPALKSDEQQKLRGGDLIRQYADTAGQYDVFWGQARS